MTEGQMREVALASFYNRAVLALSDSCACYHCAERFVPTDIWVWADGNETALCPKCGMDAVVPGQLDSTTLLAAQAYWFKAVPLRDLARVLEAAKQ